MKHATCTVSGCDDKHCALGLCSKHYQRSRATPVDPAARFWARAVPSGECIEWTGHINEHGYGRLTVNNRQILAHRHAYQLTYGTIPEGLMIDHKCHNRACVNPKHLRLATNKQNIENHSGAYRNNRAGIRGLRQRANGTWEARVNHNKVSYYLGVFASAEEANTAVVAKRNELFTRNDIDRKQEAA